MKYSVCPIGTRYGFWETLGSVEYRNGSRYLEVVCTSCSSAVMYVREYNLKHGKSTKCRRCGSNYPRNETSAHNHQRALFHREDPNKNNKSGYRGVFKIGGSYQFEFTYQGKLYKKKGFNSAEEAHQVYVELKRVVAAEDTE